VLHAHARHGIKRANPNTNLCADLYTATIYVVYDSKVSDMRCETCGIGAFK
jgi:hypothetical protein